jgi:hypothetical protein
MLYRIENLCGPAIDVNHCIHALASLLAIWGRSSTYIGYTLATYRIAPVPVPAGSSSSSTGSILKVPFGLDPASSRLPSSLLLHLEKLFLVMIETPVLLAVYSYFVKILNDLRSRCRARRVFSKPREMYAGYWYIAGPFQSSHMANFINANRAI